MHLWLCRLRYLLTSAHIVGVKIGQVKGFRKPYPDTDMEAYRISTPVNGPRTDDQRVLEPLANTTSLF